MAFLFWVMIGFLAQFIDGSLGMGYGVSASTLLIYFGIPPVITSASVHTSELFTTFVSGLAHFKFGNIRKDILIPMVSFGIIGGIIGASGLVRLPQKPIKIVVALILLIMGCLMVYRFIFEYKRNNNFIIKKYSVNKLGILGFFAALIDAIGGGGWGPICTPFLVVNGAEPHKAVGSVDLAEFFITVAISLTFMLFIGIESFRWDIVFALALGGVIAAPLAAFSCRKIPRNLLAILVGITVILLSLRLLLKR